jgi:hypothetical protein
MVDSRRGELMLDLGDGPAGMAGAGGRVHKQEVSTRGSHRRASLLRACAPDDVGSGTRLAGCDRLDPAAP